MEDMTRLIQFGTFDVSNYGDLLFPLITRQQLGDIPGFFLQAASPIGGTPDMEDCEPSVGVLDVVEDARFFKAALVGGGNIIHCNPSSLDAYNIGVRGKLGYGDLWIGPACFMPDDVPIIWNAPGVPAPFDKEYHKTVARALKRANYLSVRDEVSRKYLLEVWSKAIITVVPDPAWTVDSLWTADQLRAGYDAVFSRIGIMPPQRSVALHINRRYVGNLSPVELAKRLDRIAKLVSAQPILIAIGICHGDDIFAREIASYMTSFPIVLNKAHSLREIAACIANSCAYFGSSMHGLITACAFGVPGVSVASRKMVKFGGLVEFIGYPDVLAEGWDEAIENLRGMEFDNLRFDRRSEHLDKVNHLRTLRSQLHAEPKSRSRQT